MLVSNAICGVSGNTIKKGQSPAGGDQDDEPVAVPLSPELEELIEDKLAEAEERNSNEIILPSFPRPIPVEEAKNILETFQLIVLHF